MTKLKGKVALITGASRGIGKAIALAFARELADVVVAARSETEGRLPGTIHKTVAEIKAIGGNALAVKTDLTKDEDVQNMVQKAVGHFGHVDILVNNAGIYQSDTIAHIPIKRWDRVMGVNLRGTFLCTQAVLPYMMKQSQGCIINLSSILGTRIIGGGVASGVTKAAIERFTQGLSLEVKSHNIAVNALCPGITNTEGARMQSSDGDLSALQQPETWGRYAVFVSNQNVDDLTGKCLTAEDIEKLMQD